jgi:Zn-dependent peptidase ImmA (M78 family)
MTSKTWTEPLVLGLVAEHPSHDARVAIEAYAEELRTKAQQDSLPINVDLVASVQGVMPRRGTHDFAGRIYVETDGQLVMDLNAGDSRSRQRFTCGHEMMHTAFPNFRKEKRYRFDTWVGSKPLNQEEEYLCDFGAAALLMPANLVTGKYRLKDDGLKAVESLSHDAEVSLEAAGNRLAELAETPAAFMVFEHGYKPADRPALRRGESVEKRVRLRYAHSSALDVYLPRFKSAEDTSAIALAHRTGNMEEAIEELPGVENGGMFTIQAQRYGTDERERVLVVARPV